MKIFEVQGHASENQLEGGGQKCLEIIPILTLSNLADK